MKDGIVFVLLCVKLALAADSFEASTTDIALSVYGECSNAEDLYVCLKKKAFTLLDRLGRSQNFSISDSVKLVRPADSVPVQEEEISEKKLDELLPRSLDAKNAALTSMLSNKIAEFFGSRTLEISLPRSLSDSDDGDDDDVTDEARFGSGGKKKKGKKKMGGGGILLLIGAKLLMIKAVLIAALFFLVKKALIISKIALLLSGFIAIKKLLFAKGRGAGGAVTHVYAEPVAHGGESHVVHDGGWSSGGHGGGWSSGGQAGGWSGSGGHGGGWDKRSIDAQNLAYNAYTQKR